MAVDNFNADFDTVNIKVIGVGTGGISAINHMIDCGLDNVDYLVASMFESDLEKSKAENGLLFGDKKARSKECSDCEYIGSLAELKKDEIANYLKGANLAFFVAGLGGLTATGALPVFASIAKEMGILTVALVTRPFSFEGNRRARAAQEGLLRLADNVDTLVIISNENLKLLHGGFKTFKEALDVSNDILRQGVQSLVDLANSTGFIRLSFTDMVTAMSDAGYAHMGIGVGKGQHKAYDAATNAITSPILENNLENSKVIIINITAPPDIGVDEAEIATTVIANQANSEANIYWGMIFDEDLKDEIRITLTAIGYDSHILMIDDELKVINTHRKTNGDKNFDFIMELFKK